MTWVITRLCRDCVDQACVDVCPVECIYEYTGDDREKFPNQLYIHPDECIDCGACEPECPWEAIFEDASVPGVLKGDIELNKELGSSGAYQVPARKDSESPTPEDVAANKAKYGL